MTYLFTRRQILEEADRYLQRAAALPDTDPAKPQWIRAAGDLGNVVIGRVYNAHLTDMGIPDDLET